MPPAAAALPATSPSPGTGNAPAPRRAGSEPDDNRLPSRLWRVCKWAIATVFAVVLLVSSVFPHGPHGRPTIGAGTLALLGIAAVGLLALLWRPKYPLGIVVLTTGLVMAANLVSGPRFNGNLFALQAAASFSLVLRRPPKMAVEVALGAWLAMAGTDVAEGTSVSSLPLSSLVWLVAAVAIALYVRSQRALVVAAQERAEQADRERQRESDRALVDERARIARELHDIVAHHVSLLVVQAGAVRESVAPDHPSRELLNSMIDGGRQAMSELRAMLGALRAPGQAPLDASPAERPLRVAGLSPAPTSPLSTVGIPLAPQPSLSGAAFSRWPLSPAIEARASPACENGLLCARAGPTPVSSEMVS